MAPNRSSRASGWPPVLTRRRTGIVLAVGGLGAILSTVLAYSPYIGPLARSHTGPLPELQWIILTQLVGSGLLATGCLGLPAPVRKSRRGLVGQVLVIISFIIVSLFPLPIWVLVGTPSFGPLLVMMVLGHGGIVGLAFGMGALADPLSRVAGLSTLMTSGLAVSVPVGVGGYWLLDALLAVSSPPLLFGATLFLGPAGAAWIIIGTALIFGDARQPLTG